MIDYACTINEANIPIMVTMIREARRRRQAADGARRRWRRPPRLCGGKPERFAPYLSGNGHATAPNLIAAHRKSYDILKARVKGPVGITLALNEFQAEPGGEALRDMADHAINGQFLESLKGDDFVGVQTYTRVRFGETGRAARAGRRRRHADGLRILSRSAGSDDPPGGDA